MRVTLSIRPPVGDATHACLAPAPPHPARPPACPLLLQVKRSNWSPPSDTGLWATADRVRQRLLGELHGPVMERLQAELAFFDEVTAVSGKLYPVPKVGCGPARGNVPACVLSGGQLAVLLLKTALTEHAIAAVFN